MRTALKIVLAWAIGFGVAMLIMAVAIYFGYSNAYRQGQQTSEVYLFGLNIYHLTLQGRKYVGTPVGEEMGKFCSTISLIAIVIEELFRRLRKK